MLKRADRRDAPVGALIAWALAGVTGGIVGAFIGLAVGAAVGAFVNMIGYRIFYYWTPRTLAAVGPRTKH